MTPTPHKTDAAPGGHFDFDMTKVGGRMGWFFYEYWPLMVFFVIFLLMNAIPLTMSKAFVNPTVTDTWVWPAYGVLLIAEFAVALVIAFAFPAWIGIYLLLVSIYGLVIAEQGKAWACANMPWGNTASILFLTYLLIGNFVFLLSGRDEKKRRL